MVRLGPSRLSISREDGGGVLRGEELGGAALQSQLSLSPGPGPPRPLVQE